MKKEDRPKEEWSKPGGQDNEIDSLTKPMRKPTAIYGYNGYVILLLI